MQDADEEDVFHQQPVRHQCRGDAGCQQHLRQGVVHVLPAAAHVQLLQLTTHVRHIRLTQPIKNKSTLIKTARQTSYAGSVTTVTYHNFT